MATGLMRLPPDGSDRSRPQAGCDVVILDTMFFSPHPATGALKRGVLLEADPMTLTAKVSVTLEIPLENLRLLS